MKPPYYIDLPKETYCPFCKGNFLELYDETNRPKNYKRLLEIYSEDKRLITDKFDHMVLSHFRCSCCNRKFAINWIYGYPVPLLD